MKLFLIICAIGLASCTGKGGKNNDTLKAEKGTDTSYASKLNAPAQNMEYCFIHTDGNNAQDTTAVHLIINGNKVNGEMNWMPKEKDSRKGKLLGAMDGNLIKAQWRFMQEGTTDSISVEFKLSSQQLVQKPLIVNSNGMQETDGKAEYTVVYHMDNCSKFKKQ